MVLSERKYATVVAGINDAPAISSENKNNSCDSSDSRAQIPRTLGVWRATSIIVSSIIGMTFFLF